MTRAIYLWFYSLPIRDAVLMIFLATIVFGMLRARFGNSPYWRTGIPLLLVGWIAVIFLTTLGRRSAGSYIADPVLTPLYSYYRAISGGSQELYRANFMNMVLFYPAGFLGCSLLPKRWIPVVCTFALMSIGIEYVQYRFSMGLAEMDDVIHNTLGAILGALASRASMTRNPKK